MSRANMTVDQMCTGILLILSSIIYLSYPALSKRYMYLKYLIFCNLYRILLLSLIPLTPMYK